jgi:phosphatidylserine/phosphatidylglycerophosphate/cardiolipin synthase-like enzyme
VRHGLERILRTSPVTGIRMEPLLESALVSELIAPSPELWLVSPWISDVTVLDNGRGGYDGLLPDASARPYSLAEVLALLVRGGAQLTVVTRHDTHNDLFLRRLERLTAAGRLVVVKHDDLHEKTLCGQDWIVTGSMNFTIRGMELNDEVVFYRVDAQAAAQARVDLAHRWRNLA